MNADQMIELRMRRPFTPFELRLADGSSIRVAEPHVVATARNSPECTIYVGDDQMRFVKYREVTDVVMLPVNGR